MPTEEHAITQEALPMEVLVSIPDALYLSKRYNPIAPPFNLGNYLQSVSFWDEDKGCKFHAAILILSVCVSCQWMCPK